MAIEFIPKKHLMWLQVVNQQGLPIYSSLIKVSDHLSFLFPVLWEMERREVRIKERTNK